MAPLATTKEEAIVALRNEVQKTFDVKHSIERKKKRLKLKEFADLFIRDPPCYLTKHSTQPPFKNIKETESFLEDSLRILNVKSIRTSILAL